jgi:hypothetical protein
MSLEETILDKIRRLPQEKQEQVLRFADGLHNQAALRMVSSRDRTREMRWINANRGGYLDQWVAVQGDRMIAADKDPLKVYAMARAEASQARLSCMSWRKIRSHSCQAGRVPISLGFATSHRYDRSPDGIEIPVSLSIGE